MGVSLKEVGLIDGQVNAVDDLLENCSQPYVLADLAYLSYELREQLKQKGYHLWTPLRQNMARANNIIIGN